MRSCLMQARPVANNAINSQVPPFSYSPTRRRRLTRCFSLLHRRAVQLVPNWSKWYLQFDTGPFNLLTGFSSGCPAKSSYIRIFCLLCVAFRRESSLGRFGIPAVLSRKRIILRVTWSFRKLDP